MAFIIKNTSALINTRLTDVGRRKLSQGNFNIKYFQIGDSEVCYNCLSNYDSTNNYVIEPSYNSQNDTGTPESNKQNVKYPYYLQGGEGNTYGLPFNDSQITAVYNTATPRGFFTGNTNGWTAFTTSTYVKSSNFYVNFGNLSGGSVLTLYSGNCTTTTSGTPQVNDLVVVFLNGLNNCPVISGGFPILTYRVQSVTAGTQYNVTVDRPIPNLSENSGSIGRVLLYPSGLTPYYDSVTPAGYYAPGVLNFESICDISDLDVKVWNMNNPWKENPAGLFNTTNRDYNNFGSNQYVGTMEYLGYGSNLGQTDTGDNFYYDSFGTKITTSGSTQKTISIIHYTNNAIDTMYGEKFAMEPYDSAATDTTGFGRNFYLNIPTVMWHKNSGTTTAGLTLYVDPIGFEGLNLFQPYYIQSTENTDMNDPGIRYYYLYDNNPNPNDNDRPNKVGKVFPDTKMVIIDDEELVAALSYKSNRNWTLPAPRLGLVTPGILGSSSTTGLMSAVTESLYVTYRLDSTGYTGALHCNYYTKVQGQDSGCTINSQNVSFQVGNEFPYLSQSYLNGFTANSFKILCQKVTGDTRPSPTNWKVIDFTSSVTGSSVNGRITASGLTGQTFIITNELYSTATTYDLSSYMSLPATNDTTTLNFGDEYFFYGSIGTDIQATIYEMRFLCNLQQTNFNYTSNPTWTSGTTSYITEIGLYDNMKDLMIISKLQSPQKRQGIQQYVIKLDF